MDDQEFDKARAIALATCRKLLELESQANERVMEKSILKLLSSNSFEEEIFYLSDHTLQGFISASTWIDLIKFNLRKFHDTIENQELVNLLESTTHLHTNGEVINKPDMVKIMGSQAVGNQIVKHIKAKKIAVEKLETDKVELNVNDLMEFITTFTAPVSYGTISKSDLEKYIAAFRDHAAPHQFMTQVEFTKMLSSKNRYFIERAFHIFDLNQDGKVDLDEYTETLRKLADNNIEEAIKFLFRVYDTDGNGQLNQDELVEALKASIEENGMNFDAKELRHMCLAIWEDAGVTPGNTMSYLDFREQIVKHEALAQGLAVSITRWLIPQRKTSGQRGKAFSCHQLWSSYKSNKVLFNFIGLFLAVNIAIYIWRFYIFYYTRNHDGEYPNVLYMISRANGMCINFNSMMILFFILRYTVTLLRKMGLASKLPLDNHVYLHKFTGVLIFFQAWMHTIAHLINFAYNVAPHPVEFLLYNPNFFNASLHNIPPNCTVNITDKHYSCSGDGRPYTYWEWIFTMKPGLFGNPGAVGIANPSGVALIVVLTVMVICSMPFVRRSGHFEIFYFSHLLYIAYYVLIILHAPGPWYFVVTPIALFLAELLYRFVSISTGNLGRALITAGIVLPSKVTGLVIQRPSKFNFNPGDWVFIRIPEIAFFEWHPFTISSAPEQKDFFTLHIRGAGGWTNKLYSFFETEYKRQQSGSERKNSVINRIRKSVRHSVMRARKIVSAGDANPNDSIELEDSLECDVFESSQSKAFLNPYQNMRKKPSIVTYDSGVATNHGIDVEGGLEPPAPKGKHKEQRAYLQRPLKIYIDGPYGAPASNFFRSEHAVLVASGIGVTPFSSILQSIMLRYWHNRRICPNCSHMWTDELTSLYNLKKVDFFWINREQRSFEWFFQLLTQLEMEQAEKGGMMERFLDIHMFITAALEKTDMRAVGLQMALDLLYEKEKRDLVTGLKARTKAGRPNWDKIFKEIKEQGKGRVTVYYCGNPALGDVVRHKCEEFNFEFKKEVF